MFTGIIESTGTVVKYEPVPGTSTARLTIAAGPLVDDLPVGGSLAVNGVCLTALCDPAAGGAPAVDGDAAAAGSAAAAAGTSAASVADARGLFTADVMGETIDRTSLGSLQPGATVNLERCMPAGGRFDGHIVQGHVDGVGRILAIEDMGAWTRVRVSVPAELRPLMVEKGSVALNGTSLTITAVSPVAGSSVTTVAGSAQGPVAAQPAGSPHWLEVGLIPATLNATTFGTASPGDPVNIEADVLAKYAQQMNAGLAASASASASAEALAAAPASPWNVQPGAPLQLGTIDEALTQLRRGEPVIVVDDENRENEGDLIIPAELLTPEWMAFIVRHTSGVVCAPMPKATAQRLGLPAMLENNEDPKGTAYTVSCDLAGLETGISAAERTLTLKALADPATTPERLTRPGHVFPLIAVDGGVRERPGHTEAGVELARLAGCQPVAAIAELVEDSGEMMRLPALLEFGARFGLTVISIEDLAAYLDAAEAAAAESETAPPAQSTGGDSATVTPSPAVALPTKFGQFTAQAFEAGGQELLLITSPLGLNGEKAPGARLGGGTSAADLNAPLVRIHSECLTGDVFGSYRCDCGEQLEAALMRIAAEGGAVLYAKGHEGRGIGLLNKIRAYALQDQGRDTVEANEDLGLPADARTYDNAAAVLASVGVTRIRLLSNNPAKEDALTRSGISVAETVGIEVPPRAENHDYLATKRDRMAHLLSAF